MDPPPTTLFLTLLGERGRLESDEGVTLLVRMDGDVALRVDGGPPTEYVSFRIETRDFFRVAEEGELLPRTL